MLNLSATFDAVDHCRLICKLRDDFTITGKVLSWLKSYLKNRTSSVVLQGKYSVKNVSRLETHRALFLGRCSSFYM